MAFLALERKKMTRKLKSLGLAMIAVFAMSAVVASAAQAVEGEFMSEVEPASITATNTNTHTFTTPAGIKLECTSAKFTNTSASKGKTLTMQPSYSGCSTKVLGVTFPVKVTIGTEGHKCDYLFSAGTETSADHYSGTVAVKCEKSTENIQVDVFSSKANEESNTTFCVLNIAELNNGALGPIKYTNNTAATPKKDVVVEAEVGSIKTTRTGSALCGAASSEASYSGNATTVGEAGGNPTGVTIAP